MKEFNLPEVAHTWSGVEFYPNADLWKFRDGGGFNVHLDFNKLPVVESLKKSSKAIILWHLENKSPTYSSNLFTSLLFFSEIQPRNQKEQSQQ